MNKLFQLHKKNANLNNVKTINFLINHDFEWLSEFNDQSIDFIIANPPFTPDDEYNSDAYNKIFPQVSTQSERALRTFDKEGTKPYIDIVNNSKKLGTNHFLFRINPQYIDRIHKGIERLNCSITVIEDNGNKRFLYVERN